MDRISRKTATDLQLWKRFQSGRCSEEEVQRSVVLQRWARCRAAGLSADSPGEPVVSLAGLAEAIDRYSPHLAPGAPFDAFATTIAKVGFCGVLCDDTGTVVARRIAAPFEARMASSRLVEGALWSESARGTNGIGTTLFEQRPLAILGAEHYEQRNHGLACFAAPIRDVHERVVGVLDATGPITVAARYIHASVVASAAAIEALILARTYDGALAGGLFELERTIERLPHAALVVEATGHVRRANSRCKGIGTAVGRSGWIERLQPILGAPRRGLLKFDDASGPLRGLTAEIEPIGTEGQPFAAIVHLVPRRQHVAARLAADAFPEAFRTIVGSDPVIVAARARAAQFAGSDLPVLLIAETGTGKEVFARCIHAGSERHAAPFVAVNCGALTGTLLESELFGYGPGAFTGAAPAGRTGKLAAAHGGTLFLDEVGEMSAAAQAALLRFLEDGTYYRVGESVERRADVRLIAATGRDLPQLVESGQFRSDLFFRMRGVLLRLPPLRERNDRRELALAMLEIIARARGVSPVPALSPAALAWIDRQDWPGNVRELKSALNYAVVMAAGAPTIELWHLPIEEVARPTPDQTRAGAERAALQRALDQSSGNLSVAAKALGVARTTLYRMLVRHDLHPPESRKRRRTRSPRPAG